LGENHHNNGWSEHPQFAEPPANAPINYSTLLNTPDSFKKAAEVAYKDLSENGIIIDSNNNLKKSKGFISNLCDIPSKICRGFKDYTEYAFPTSVEKQILAELESEHNSYLGELFTPIISYNRLKGIITKSTTRDSENVHPYREEFKKFTKKDVIRVNILHYDEAENIIGLIKQNPPIKEPGFGENGTIYKWRLVVTSADGKRIEVPYYIYSHDNPALKYLEKIFYRYLNSPNRDQLALKHAIKLQKDNKQVFGTYGLKPEENDIL
jgi:hypothetical protein